MLASAAIATAQPPPIEWPRIEISVDARRLWVVTEQGDTLRSAPIAVGSGRTLEAEGRSWTFETPLGPTLVIRKDVAPDWVPPDWHYIELARSGHLQLAQLPPDRAVVLADGRELVVRGAIVGLVGADRKFRELSATDDLVFDGVLYVPPFGTRNRRIPGILGAYRLQLANGIGLHGTPDTASIGAAASHGCIRLYDDDIAWLHANLPVGTRVIIR
jgi:hypothetical protein